MKKNLILSTDSYKFSQFQQYPPGTEYVESYVCARKSTIPGCDETVVFGLQSWLLDLKPITREDIEEAAAFLEKHGLPFYREGWEYILNENHGFLPLTIKAVPEGKVVPVGNVLATVRNTDPKCAWLVSYMETEILRAFWYGSTVASISRHAKKLIMESLKKTGTPSEIDFKLHDFGFRGVSSFESAAIGGAAHLINFMGTDTVAGIQHVMDYFDSGVCGFSIPASEHSTITSWGQKNELDAYANMVEKFGHATFACVCDSYDIYEATRSWARDPRLLPKVKEMGGRCVIRPDSGDPVQVPIDVIKILMEEVGYTVNSAGYKVLPSHVRVIQGDGITVETIPLILENLEKNQLSADNLAFGMGGGLLQHVNRDTFGFAMKCSAIRVDGQWKRVKKNPITDSGKASLSGLLHLIKDKNGVFRTVDALEVPVKQSYLEHCFVDGLVLARYPWDKVRARAALR